MTPGAIARQADGSARVAFGLLAFASLILAALFASPGWADSGICIRAEIAHSIRLPHGEVLPPGTLRLCQGKLSPVSHLHRTYLDGRLVGVLMSRGRTSEASASDAPVVMFKRGEDGSLELVGYVLPGSPDSYAFSFVPHGTPLNARERVSQPEILVAAAFD
jgi:hypothetical protein